MTGTGKVMVKFGDLEFEHHEMTDAQRRYTRATWLVANMPPEVVRKAIEEKKLEPDAYKFVEETASLCLRIAKGEADPEDLLPVVLDRLEDAHMWTLPYVELTAEQKLRVLEWCREDGHDDLADEIEDNLNKEEEDA